MLYSVLIYGTESVLDATSKEDQERYLQQHLAFQAPLREEGKLGGAVRLMSTASAVTIKGGPLGDTVLDGPFAETKEQLLGFYLIECDTLEEAIEAAKKLPYEAGSVEIRPVGYYDGGQDKGEPIVFSGD